MIFDILFLPLVFFIGLITSYEDIRYGKVKNKWIILGLVWGLIVIIAFLIWYPIAPSVSNFYYSQIKHLPDDVSKPVVTVNLDYLVRVIINAVIALVIAFLMWRFNAWAAGDAKLFTVYALLIPLGYYWKTYLSIFPSFVLLVNIFIPIFLYLLIRATAYFIKFIYLKISQPRVVNKKRKPFDKKKIWGRIKSMGIILLTFINIFLFFGLFKEPIESNFSIDITSLYMFIFVGLILFSGYLGKIFQKPIAIKIIIALLVLILAYGFSTSPINTWQVLERTVKMMIVFMTILTLFRALIDFHVSKTGTKEIKIEELDVNMNLDDQILNRTNIGRIYPGGLTLKQVEKVKKWLKKNEQGIKTIKIYKPFPFVTWMFIGVIITLILKSSFLSIILSYIYQR